MKSMEEITSHNYILNFLTKFCMDKYMKIYKVLILFTVIIFVVFVLRFRTDSMQNQNVAPNVLINVKAKNTTGNPGNSEHGTWTKMINNPQLFAYTAFYDDRMSLGSFPVIRLITVSEEFDYSKLKCIVWYSRRPYMEETTVTAMAIGYGVGLNGKHFKEHILTCPLKHETRPSWVSISSETSSNSLKRIVIEFPPKPAQKDFIAVCVSVTYWRVNPYQLIEWAELLKVFGASKMFLYNNSIYHNADNVLNYYIKEGFIELKQTNNFVQHPAEQNIHLHMSPAINDCIYRHMFTYKHIAVTDLDEMIIPRQHLDYKSLIKELEESNPFQASNHYVFRNVYFFKNMPLTNLSQTNYLSTIKHRWHAPVSGPGYSVKSIINPQACTNMHNHACWGNTKLNVGNLNIDVDESLGMNQHYKKCHFNKDECDEMLKKMIYDEWITQFSFKITGAANRAVSALDLLPLQKT